MPLLSDRAEPGVLGHFEGATDSCGDAYVDNLGVVSVREGRARELIETAAECFDESGLTTHEQALQCEDAETLGTRLDGQRRMTRLTPKRLWRLRQALAWALARRALPGRVWEVLLGHCTFCSLIDRWGPLLF